MDRAECEKDLKAEKRQQIDTKDHDTETKTDKKKDGQRENRTNGQNERQQLKMSLWFRQWVYAVYTPLTIVTAPSVNLGIPKVPNQQFRDKSEMLRHR